MLNNLTNDPLMVFPVQPARTTAQRYVLAGIAESRTGKPAPTVRERPDPRQA